jgi:hypothetical protein
VKKDENKVRLVVALLSALNISWWASLPFYATVFRGLVSSAALPLAEKKQTSLFTPGFRDCRGI